MFSDENLIGFFFVTLIESVEGKWNVTIWLLVYDFNILTAIRKFRKGKKCEENVYLIE